MDINLTDVIKENIKKGPTELIDNKGLNNDEGSNNNSN